VDLEEAKGQEITKLQNALQEMQGKLDEAHQQILHEKEAAQIAIETAPPVIKEVPVVDNTKSTGSCGAKLQKWCHVSKMEFGTRNVMAPEFS
ncbi:hypothetical protein Tco_0258160, partial [Tanacetum coccineum]